MLVELTKMEQRYDAVMAVIRDGFPVAEVAEKFGVSRQSVHAWMTRYEHGGIDGLADRSHRPRSSPLQMPAAVETRVVELRRQHPTWGHIRIQHQLARDATVPLPSASAVYRAFVRHGLIEPKATRKKVAHYKRWERGRPMELWQMDVVGGVLLADGTECKVLTGVDDHSRFCVCAGVMVRASARPVCGFFAQALARHGVPEEVLTDNAKVFANRFALKPTEVLFDKICRENGITHRLTAPASPTTTGKIERFHRTLRQEFLAGRLFASLPEVQAQLDAWVDDYNTNRPHRSLKMQTPAERFAVRAETATPAPALDLSALSEVRTGDGWVARVVSAVGTISVSNQVISAGKHRSGHQIDVRVLAEMLELWDGPELLKTVLRTSRGEVRKKKAERH